MIMRVIIGICIISTAGWTFEDFYKSAWTPNQRLITGILLALVTFCEVVVNFSGISYNTGILMSVAMVIMFFTALVIELKSSKEALRRQTKLHNKKK